MREGTGREREADASSEKRCADGEHIGSFRRREVGARWLRREREVVRCGCKMAPVVLRLGGGTGSGIRCSASTVAGGNQVQPKGRALVVPLAAVGGDAGHNLGMGGETGNRRFPRHGWILCYDDRLPCRRPRVAPIPATFLVGGKNASRLLDGGVIYVDAEKGCFTNRRFGMQRRKLTREFKLAAVRLIKDRSVAVAQAARDLDVHGNLMRHPEPRV